MTLVDSVREIWRNRGPRGLLPSPRAGLDLLGHGSTYLLLVAFLVTAVAKTLHLQWISGIPHPVVALLGAISLDLVVYLGLAVAFAAVEILWPRAHTGTIAVASALALFAVANAVYLGIAGDQASRGAVEALFDRFGDVVAIFEHAATATYALALGLGAIAAVAIYVVARRRRSDAGHERAARAILALWLVLLGGVLMVSTPRPRQAEVRRLGRNVLVTIARAYIAPTTRGSFAGYDAPGERDKTDTPSAPEQNMPHILLVVLESTRWDHTTMSGENALAQTPTLASLAEDGFQVETMRAVVPHTTKALFTMLCGQLPLLQRELWELSGDIRPTCLPRMLGELGYHTAFIQSAQGLFEQRARLVDKLGYDHFVPWEDIRGQRLGYLASDDASMLRPMRRWLDSLSGSGNPVFITLLTSSPHHPYKLPTRIQNLVDEQGLPAETDAEKYARLVEGEDDLLERLLDVLEFRSMRENTILIMLGDHGEGFGKHGAKQHDQNLYEEGIRVPFVVAGPGIPKRTARGNANALDFLPTVLDLLNLDLPDPAEFPGVNLARDDVPPDRPSWMSCWFADRCRGFVVDKRKVMHEPDTGELFYFDLEADPDEQAPLPLTPDLEQLVEKMDEVFEQQTITGREIVHPELRRYGVWWCPEDDDKCKHPRARHPDFRYKQEPKEGARAPVKLPGKAPAPAGGSRRPPRENEEEPTRDTL